VALRHGFWDEGPTVVECRIEGADTLPIELRDLPIAETRELDENTLLDVDANGQLCAITIEHATDRAGAPQFTFECVGA